MNLWWLPTCCGDVQPTTHIVLGKPFGKKKSPQLFQAIMHWDYVARKSDAFLTNHLAAHLELAHFVFTNGGHAGKSEHAAGVAIYLRDKVFAEHNVKQIYDIPADFQGRLGILRVKRGDVDFAFIVVDPWVQARTIQEQQRIRRLWAYVGSVVSALPYRCVPIMFTDANAKNGLCKTEGGDWQPIDSPSIGPCTPEVENASGLVFRNMLEQQFLCSANSFMEPGHTYFGNIAGVKSRIDHICIPQSMLTNVVSCAVLYSVGAKLQRIFGPGKRDHVPVNIVFRHASSFSGDKAKSSCKWDRSLLADGVLRGDCRRDLVNGIVRKCRATDIPRLATGTGSLPTPSAVWKQIRDVVWDSAYSLNKQKPPKLQNRPADTQSAIEAHLQARTAVAQLPRSIVPWPERHHSHQFLAEILFQWRASIKFYNARASGTSCLGETLKCDWLTEWLSSTTHIVVETTCRYGNLVAVCQVFVRFQNWARTSKV